MEKDQPFCNQLSDYTPTRLAYTTHHLSIVSGLKFFPNPSNKAKTDGNKSGSRPFPKHESGEVLPSDGRTIGKTGTWEGERG